MQYKLAIIKHCAPLARWCCSVACPPGGLLRLNPHLFALTGSPRRH